MSELKKAKQRLNLRATEFDSRENEIDFTEKSFRRSPHSQSIPKLQNQRRFSTLERYSEMEELDQNEIEDDFSRYSPEFSRTGRVFEQKKDDEIFGNRSERISLFQKQPSRQRRGTQYTKIINEESRSMSKGGDFTEREKSIYN